MTLPGPHLAILPLLSTITLNQGWPQVSTILLFFGSTIQAASDRSDEIREKDTAAAKSEARVRYPCWGDSDKRKRFVKRREQVHLLDPTNKRAARRAKRNFIAWSLIVVGSLYSFIATVDAAWFIRLGLVVLGVTIVVLTQYLIRWQDETGSLPTHTTVPKIHLPWR